MADTIMNYPLSCNTVSPSSITNNNFQKSLSLYPNPANTEIILSWSDAFNNHIKSFQLLNAIGEKINIPFVKSNSKLNLNIASIANGIYFINLQTDQESSTLRFLKK
jgi:hypothetical protein